MAYKKTITLGLDYSQFTAGVTECNQKMKLLDNEFKLAQAQMDGAGQGADKLALREDYLTQKIYLQQQKVEAAKQKYNELMEAHADTSRIDRADEALLQERTTLQLLQNELEETRLANSGLKEALTATVAVAATVSGGFLACAQSAAQYCDDLATLSAQTGIAMDTLQEWEYASELMDVSVDTMTSSMAKMIKNMDNASKGTGNAADAFTKLGVKLTDTHGHMRDSEDVFYDVIDALGEIENQTERDQIAMNIFGKSAQDLAGAIDAGSEGFKEYAEEAHKMGLVMSEEQIDKGLAASDAFEKFSSTMEALKNNLGTSVLPILTALFEAIASIPQPVLATITVILSVIATIVSLVMTINAAVKAGGAVKTMINTLMGGMDSTYVKIVAITVAITALIVAIGVLIGKGKEMQGTFSSIGGMSSVPQNRAGNVGYNANGTQNWRGGWTWTGEHGPELAYLPAGTQIFNNTESKQMAGNKNYYVTMNCDLSKMKKVSDVVEAVEGLAESMGCGV